MNDAKRFAMRWMSKALLSGFVVALGSTAMDGEALANTAANPFTAPIIAGGGNGHGVQVGTLDVWDDGTYLYVKYDGWSSWCLDSTNLDVATSWKAIPQSNGNPVPGHFPHSSSSGSCAHDYTYQISLSSLGVSSGSPLYIAAHANVAAAVGAAGAADLTALAVDLPAQATVTVTGPFAGGLAYFPAETITNGGALDGSYPGWCIDPNDEIFPGESYTVDVYSTYGSLPPSLVPIVHDPQNFPLVNWVINQGFVGTTAADGTPYTYSDEQIAIWTLLGETPVSGGIEAWTQDHVDAIVAAAQANGQGFVPGCDQSVAVILVPVGTTGQGPVGQVIIAQVTIAKALRGPVCRRVGEPGEPDGVVRGSFLPGQELGDVLGLHGGVTRAAGRALPRPPPSPCDERTLRLAVEAVPLGRRLGGVGEEGGDDRVEVGGEGAVREAQLGPAARRVEERHPGRAVGGDVVHGQVAERGAGERLATVGCAEALDEHADEGPDGHRSSSWQKL